MHNFSDILSAQSQTLTAFYRLSASCRIPRLRGYGDVADMRNISDATQHNQQGPVQLCCKQQKSNETCKVGQGCVFSGNMNAIYLSRDSRSHIICDALLSFLAAFFQVPLPELRGAGRGTSVVARIRQFGMSMSEVAYGFKRERTTVKHACHLIEDLREDAEFDRRVCDFEGLIHMIYPAPDNKRGYNDE
jgi:hypothetical protein